MTTKKAIYLSGGGARGAYQVGVLKAISDIVAKEALPVEILSSVSVGSINAAFLAQHADDFSGACKGLEKLWLALSPSQVYRTDKLSLLRSVFRNLRSFLFHVEGNGFLLNAAPLKQLLTSNLDFSRIHDNIHNGLCELDVATINYEEKRTISYYQSSQTYPSWYRERHRSEKTSLSINHILASSALPLFFEPIVLNEAHHGDGGLRLANPLRSAIKMGAEKILVIGTRKAATNEPLLNKYELGISFASLLGQMLNAVFLDNLDREIQQIRHINEATRCLSSREQEKLLWRPIDVLAIKPSQDIGEIATELQSLLPAMLRYLLSSLGESHQSGDILSFLMFDKLFSQKLIELGYADAMKQKSSLERFFS